MAKKLFLLVLMVVAGIIVCNASKIDGKWKATMDGPNGSMELVFTFKADGDKLTGTTTSPMGEEIQISNGKVNGEEFSFDIDMGGNPVTHKCKLDGEVIKMKIEMDGGMGEGPGEITLKKVE